MQNIRFADVLPFSEPETVRGIVAVYQQAFGGAPWNEGLVCPMCGAAFSFGVGHIGSTCPLCAEKGEQILLLEYWPTAKVASDFYREMKKPDACCLVARLGNRIVGFIWGYRVVVDGSIDDYLESPGLSRLIDGEFFYIDDVAVVPECQGKGIGSGLVRRMLRTQPGKNILARTLDQSRMFRILTKLNGKAVLSITRGRVIMAVTP